MNSKKKQKIKATTKDTAYVFIPLERAEIKHAYDEYILVYKDIPVSSKTQQVIREILASLVNP